MSNGMEIILCWIFVGVLWILARRIGYKEGFKDGYELGQDVIKACRKIEQKEKEGE